MVAGGGASVVYADTISDYGFGKVGNKSLHKDAHGLPSWVLYFVSRPSAVVGWRLILVTIPWLLALGHENKSGLTRFVCVRVFYNPPLRRNSRTTESTLEHLRSR